MSIILNGTTGITTPADTVTGNATVGGTLNVTGASTLTGAVTATTITSPAATALTIQSAGTTAMTIDTSQNVGIGTSSPGYKLTVNGQTSFAANQYVRVGAAFFAAGDGSTINYLFCGSTALAVRNSADSAEFMRIDSSGNLLVGQTSNWTTGLISTTAGNSNGISARSAASTSGYSAIIVRTDRTDCNLTAFFFGTTQVGSITTNTSSTAYNTSSDYRLKENVASMTNGLATIASLRPVTYDWISDKSHGAGFIAHELQSIIPDAVTGEKDAVNEDGSIRPQGVDYSKIVVHLVAACQELSAKNDALEARLAALEAK